MKKKIFYILLSIFAFLGVANAEKCTVVTGSGKNIGDEIACGSEHFYVLSNDGKKVRMLSKYNLLVGKSIYEVNFTDPYYNSNDVYTNKEVQQLLIDGYSINKYYSDYDSESTRYYYGVYMEKSDYYDRTALFFDTYPTKVIDVLKDAKVQEILNKGYLYNYPIKDSSNNIIGVQFSKEQNYEFKTVIFETTPTSTKEILNDEYSKKALNEGYIFSSIISEDSKYIAAVFLKNKKYEYKTVLLDGESITNLELYQNEEVKALLNDGYNITNSYYTTRTCSSSATDCKYDYYAIVFNKSYNEDYVNIIFDKEYQRTSEALEYLESNDVYKEKIAEGYSINNYYYNHIYYSSYSYINHPVGVILSKKNDNVLDIEVLQDETALGIHGEAGSPIYPIVGVVNDSELIDITRGEIKDGNSYGGNYYQDLDLSTYDTLMYYSNTIESMGYEIEEVTLLSVSELNELVKILTGSEIPLESWYENKVYIEEADSYILGNIQELLDEKYSWLWSTTYWLRTKVVGTDFNLYEINTLGDLCTSNLCSVNAGIGLRPVVTVSASNIIYKITTKTDGNGTIDPTKVEAEEGEMIEFTITPNEGYELKEVKVTDSNGNTVTFTDYKFTMPDANVIIEATFVPVNPDTSDIIIIASITIIIGSFISYLNIKKMKELL